MPNYSGVWTLPQQMQATAGGLWPVLYDPYFDYVSLLLTGDGTNGAQNNTFLDSSSNAFTITRNGNTTQGTFSPYGSLWSNYFDGVNDWLALGTQSIMNVGTGDITLECWVNFPAVSNTHSRVSICNPIEADISSGITVALDGATQGSSGLRVAVAGTSQTYATAIKPNTWHHIAVVRSSGTVKAYLNGVAVLTFTASGSLGNPSFNIGALKATDNFYSDYYTGYISNFRIVKGTAVYTSNFTPSTTPLTAISGTSLLTCQSNRFIDNSSNAFAITVNGNTSVQRFSPFNPTAPYSTATIGGSGYFDGTGDYLSVGSATNWAFLNNGSDWTVEFDVFHSSTSQISIATTTTTASQIGVAIFLNYSANAVGVEFYRGVAGSYATFISSAYLQINQWNHVAITFANSGKTCSFYINGVAAGSSSNTGFAYSSSNPSNTLTVAAAANNPSITLLTGYLANLRISDNVRTGLTTLPTAPYTSDANTKLLCNFTNAGIPDAAMMNDLETVGNAQVSTSVVKYGTGSLAFDGNGDYLLSPDSPDTELGSGDFTVECWAYYSSTSGTPVLIDKRASTAGYSPFIFYTTGGALVFYASSNGSSYDIANGVAIGSVVANQWYHVAASRSGTSIRLFLNGVLGNTVTSSAALVNNTSAWSIGGTVGGNYFNGYIDDLRITKGYARYTANFIPPDAALPTY